MYIDRYDAGNKVADLLIEYKDTDKRILAIPNGGVPVAESIVNKIGGKMGLLIVRKLQIPYNPEAGFGAVTMDGTVIFNKKLMKYLRLTQFQIQQVIIKTKADIFDRVQYYGIDYTNFNKEIENKLVILVDDGLASGYTMLAAIESIKNYSPSKIIVAVPTAPKRSIDLVSEHAKIICPNIRETEYFAVADAYKNWYDLDKNEVLKIINSIKNNGNFI